MQNLPKASTCSVTLRPKGARYAFGAIYFIRYVGCADVICSALRNVKEKIRLADFHIRKMEAGADKTESTFAVGKYVCGGRQGLRALDGATF